MVTRRGRAAPMSPDERRRTIVEATVPLLREHGAAVTTRQVAEAAGIAEGTIFRVFPDKRALLLAAAEETVNPTGARARMAEELAGIERLEDKVAATAKHLLEGLEQALDVMVALRPQLAAGHSDEPRRHGPPAFLVESNRQLLANLTDLLFAPHAAELRVEPARAALVLRSLVFGAWHPGMADEVRLSPEDIAEACMHGIARHSAEEGPPCC